jgi:hypothetical protein
MRVVSILIIPTSVTLCVRSEASAVLYEIERKAVLMLTTPYVPIPFGRKRCL